MTEQPVGLRSITTEACAAIDRCSRFLADASGATAAVFALALPVLIGVGALAIDVGVWSIKSRQAQGVADQAAYSAAVADSVGSDGTTEGQAIAAGLGYVNGTDGVTVTVSNPPTSGAYAGSTTYWQVTIQQPQALGLAAYFISTTPNVVARAVAGVNSGGSCFIALSPTAANAIRFQENAEMLNPRCGLYANSSADNSIRCDPNCIISGSLYTVGEVDWKKGSPPGPVSEGQEPFADPYADVPKTIPSGMPCKPLVTTGGNYLPGRYCDGFSLPNNVSGVQQTLNLAPGVYYIEKQFLLTNNYTINGTGGVTLVFSVPRARDFNIGNNNIFEITAPTSGPYGGIAMMSVAGTYPVTFENNTNAQIQGALYFPNQPLVMKNNLDNTRCTQLVALTIELLQNATTQNNCPGSGIRGIDGGKIALVE